VPLDVAEGLHDTNRIRMMSTALTGRGLRRGALGFISSTVIGIASTAPAYSVAASLGVVVAAVGVQSAAALLVGFVPMLLIAGSYYAMNRIDPDCGTTFAWVARALGPVPGWMAGWALLAADILVMPSLAQIAGKYTFLLFGAAGLASSTLWVTVAGVAWIITMTAICYVGIEVAARTQWVLLLAELATLVLFTVAAFIGIFHGGFPDAVRPRWAWLNPLAVSGLDHFTLGVLAAVFIFWGWDTAVAVNEETADERRSPGLAAVLSTLLLLAIYLAVTVAATGVHGPDFLARNQDDVLSPLGRAVLPLGLDKALIVAVLTSAAASTQTTILPATRTALSMAALGAAPARFAAIHPRYQTPSFATIWVGGVSVAAYVAMSCLSQDVLDDSVKATGLMIAFYLGITGVACAWFFRCELLRDARVFLIAGLGSALGALLFGLILVSSCLNLFDPRSAAIGLPLAITLFMLVLGIVLLALQWRAAAAFFRRRPEVAPAGARI
jgi:amino acid transporter